MMGNTKSGVIVVTAVLEKVRIFNKYFEIEYTQYSYQRTRVNVLVLVVLIFSQNFSTNGPYVNNIFFLKEKK